MNSNYELGKSLSRHHKKRDKESSIKLYKIIEEAVDLAQLRDGDRSEQAMNFLIVIFTPHISKISYNIHSRIYESTEIKDVKQEVKIMFMLLIDKYDKKKSTFPYYIAKMLPKYMNKWARKERDYIDIIIPLGEDEDYIIDPIFDSFESTMDYFNNYLLEKEYIDFIKINAEKKSRSSTHREVCLNFFLSSNSCKQIAKKQNISYNAVYEVIGKVKDELQYFFHTSIYTDYVLTSGGTVKVGIKGKVISN